MATPWSEGRDISDRIEILSERTPKRKPLARMFPPAKRRVCIEIGCYNPPTSDNPYFCSVHSPNQEPGEQRRQESA